MPGKNLKKLFATFLAFVLILTCAAASASTVEVRIAVDQEAAPIILKSFGIPDEQMVVINPVLSLINALGVRVITAEDGAQVDLDLKGETALSLGYASDEQHISLVSTLIPNYVLNLKQETLGQMMESFMSNMPGISTGGDEEGAMSNIPGTGTGGAEDGTMSIMPVSLTTYINSFTQVCAEAAVPGEPVKGEYQFDGYNFDTMVPIIVDVPKIKDAFHSMTEEMLKDETVVSSIGSYMQMFGMETDPEQLQAALNEFEAHFPDTVTAEYYQNGEEAKPFYLTGRAQQAEKDEPTYEYTMFCKDEKDYTMTYMDHEQGIVAGMILTDDDFRIEYKQGEMNFILDFTMETGEPAVYRCDLFFMDTDKPLISVLVTVSADGERTLPVKGEEKTALALEDLMDGKSDAASGLMTDFMMNGFSPLMVKLSQAAPEAAQLITTLMMPQSNQQTTKETESEPQAEADPSSWKTLADILTLKTESKETSWDGQNYFLIFRYAGTEWMVKADVSPEQNDAAFAVDYSAEDRDEQIMAILGECAVLTVIDIGKLALPQEDLDQWIGKTGRDLLDAGWEYNGYHSDENGIRVCMVNGDFQYLVSFEEEMITTQVFGEQPENMTTATISGITFDGKSYNFDETNYTAP